jgi:ABC-type Mn2+/Zn2+ transport system ATPase subunit
LALSRDPEVLLLDEPFNHIDETVASAVSETLATWLRADRSIVLVSHNCHLMKPLEARAAVREIHLNQPPPEERG